MFNFTVSSSSHWGLHTYAWQLYVSMATHQCLPGLHTHAWQLTTHQCLPEVIGVYARQGMGEDGEEVLLSFWIPAVSPIQQLSADGSQALQGGQHLVRLRQSLQCSVRASKVQSSPVNYGSTPI